jgi:hypothetical protein
MSTRPPLTGFETRLLAELRQVVAERAAAAPGPADRALAGPAAPTRPAAPTGPAARPWPRRRLAMTGALSAAVAASLAVALTVARLGGGPPAGPGFAAPTTPAAVLNNAALAALREPAVTPRADQFVYVRMLQIDDQVAVPGYPADHAVATTESWRSASGTREGRSLYILRDNGGPPKKMPSIMFWCEDGHVQPTARTSGKLEPCTPQEFSPYRPGLPTTTAGMLAYLAHLMPFPDPIHHAGDLGAVAFDLLTKYALTPAQQAAMFHSLARVPHLTIVPKVTDALGRTGVGIRFRAGRLTWTAIFDPRTFRPLGRDITSGLRTDRIAVAVPATIVDRVGQRP